MGDSSKQAVLRILPGLQYLAWAAHDSGAEPVSGWIGEAITRIVAWNDGTDKTAGMRSALAQVLADARRAGLEETARHLEHSLSALETDCRRLEGG